MNSCAAKWSATCTAVQLSGVLRVQLCSWVECCVYSCAAKLSAACRATQLSGVQSVGRLCNSEVEYKIKCRSVQSSED